MDAGNNIFLDLTGPAGPVAGSCRDHQFKGKIELKSFSFSVAPVPRGRVPPPPPPPPPRKAPGGGLRQSAPQQKTDGQDEEKPERRRDDAITVVKVIDASSADLLLSYCKHLESNVQGQEFKQAVITFRLTRGSSTIPLLVLNFTGLYVIDYQLEEISKDTTQPTEKVSFSYKTCTIEYTAVSAGDAGAAPRRSVTWSRTARKA